jgi:hypothetical protein
VNSELVLPSSAPTLTRTRAERSKPCATLQATALSDSHPVASVSLTPNLEEDVLAESPKPAPCKVTLALPVNAELDISMTLAMGAPAESANVADPISPPTVTDSRRVPLSPLPGLDCNEVSDCHADASQLHCDTRELTEYVGRPNPVPETVRTIDPEVALLPKFSTLGRIKSEEMDIEIVPPNIPVVTVIDRERLTPALFKQRIDVSDPHSVLSQPV